MRKALAERFWEKVDKGGPEHPVLKTRCWIWVACRTDEGYGRIIIRGWVAKAHRVAWELANGPIRAGLLVCHRCDNPPCCNPAHLFEGTGLDNSRDMVAKGRGKRRNFDATHCRHGHAYTTENTYWDGGFRKCATCVRQRNLQRYYRQKAS
jgi:hypothetical protein